ncbi:hypothetical protein R5R35_010208 [Gryllus longicercus]|uniref:Myb-like domain-containing protein n=1 Tax=Gryllus longicercus TaxID=2509291 RepID=A0AAN9WHR7_9ORTH
MSQISKKTVSMPVRKRLKPTVNLNVAFRRRRDAKETPSVTDVLAEDVSPELSKSSNGSNEESVTHQTTNIRREGLRSSREIDNDLNTTFESEKSFSSEKTVLLQDYVKHTSEKNDKSQPKISVSKGSPCKSVSSSVTTVLMQNDEGGSRKSLRDDLEQSIDELDGFHSSNLEVEKGSIEVPSCKTDVAADNDVYNRENALKNSNISDELRLVSCSEQMSHDPERGREASTHVSGYESRKSASSNVPEALPQREENVDLQSLNGDSISSDSVQSDLRPSSDMSPPKYKRKMSSMAKQLSEARRDFEIRFSNKKPERSALRMFDLIYYNPSTNPMKASADNPKEIVVSSPSDNTDTNRAIEEDVDNPSEEEHIEDDNESGIPAPRVKVGPNGEIVLDEQSLVIETTQSKKSRQEIANLTVVVDSGSNTTYHTYSKKKRQRNEWSVKETIRFYKALQTLGTDFSLMQSLFPSRSRVDLKSKFKKEERINGHLIEKALRFPSLFDLSELEKEQIVEEKKNTNEKKRKAPKQRVKKRSLKSLGFDEDDIGPPLKDKKKKGMPCENKGKDTEKENMETQHIDCISDDEYQPPATEQEKIKSSKVVSGRRSSRVLNGKILNYAAVENKHDFLEAGIDLLESCDSDEDNDSGNAVEDVQEVSPTVANNFDMNNVAPGSLVIVTTQHPDNPGYQICNVFMVQERSDQENVVSVSTQDISSTQSSIPPTPSESIGSVGEPS